MLADIESRCEHIVSKPAVNANNKEIIAAYHKLNLYSLACRKCYIKARHLVSDGRNTANSTYAFHKNVNCEVKFYLIRDLASEAFIIFWMFTINLHLSENLR